MPPLLLALVQAGTIDQATAERLARQLDPEFARAWGEATIEDAFSGGLAGQRARLLELLEATDNNPTAAQLNQFWAAEDRTLWESVQSSVLEVVDERAALAAIGAGLDTTFDLVSQSVIDWAEDYYINADLDLVGSIPNLNLTARTRFQTAFVRWQRGELDVVTPGGGLPDLIAAIEPVFGRVRAEAIAVTETTRIFTESLRLVEAGNPFTVGFTMHTARDEKVCFICSPLDGQFRTKDQPYYIHPELGNVYGPNFHVRCRCGETPETELTLKVT